MSTNNIIDDLKEKILKAQEEGDIASLYVLEAKCHDNFDEETLIAYYANILELALERLTDVLEKAIQLDMTEVQDYATLRALYEYAIEHYSAGKPEDAAALFEILSGLSKDKNFAMAMKVHNKASTQNISFDDFLDKIADLDATNSAGNFYISSFKTEI
jgi:hypothetical protein